MKPPKINDAIVVIIKTHNAPKPKMSKIWQKGNVYLHSRITQENWWPPLDDEQVLSE